MTDKQRNYRNISWEEVTSAVKRLAQKIKNMPNFDDVDGVIGIERGGVIPAVMLSHVLNIPFTSWDSILLELEYAIAPPPEGRFLIVDDIADSGGTFNDYSDDKNVICSLFLRKHTCLKEIKDRLIYAKEINNDDWLVFPWELDDKIIDFASEDWV